MILGVYRQNRPKALWSLVSFTQSAEVAKQDKATALAKAIKDGKKDAKVAILTFDTASWMPDALKDKEVVEDERLLYN